MFRKVLALVVLLSLLSGCSYNGGGKKIGQRTVVDMAGRSVRVPVQINRVLSMSPVGLVLLYTLKPELIAGWNYQPSPDELAYYPEPLRKLPVLGGWYGKNSSANLERVMQAKPDLILSMGDAMGLQMADRIQQQTHIPVFILSGGLKNLPAAYTEAGKLFSTEAKAAQLADECRRAIDDVESKVKSIPLAKRRRLYYAEGPKGLQTEPGDSMHSEALVFAGAVNVATVPNQQGYGNTPVSMEQVLKWNPEIIITGYDHTSTPGEFYKSVWTDPAWRRVAAVRNHQVFETPQYPFNWIDRPPSANRILGIKWAANLFYPDIFHYDMRKETRHFYDVFYHVQLSDAQLDQILAYSTPQPAAKTH